MWGIQIILQRMHPLLHGGFQAMPRTVRLDPSATTLVLGVILGKVFGGICRHPEMHDEEELSEPVQFSALDSERS